MCERFLLQLPGLSTKYPCTAPWSPFDFRTSRSNLSNKLLVSPFVSVSLIVVGSLAGPRYHMYTCAALRLRLRRRHFAVGLINDDGTFLPPSLSPTHPQHDPHL